ncbi:carbonic anhydrase [Nitrospira sp.]|nr:carbonic anhydrase [Nitrospira sp.]
MQKSSMGLLFLGLVLIGPNLPASASLWEHTEESQGHDGTLWANISGEPSSNAANLPYVFAECAIGTHQSPIAINVTSNPTPISVNPKTQSLDNNPPAEREHHVNSLTVRYTPSTSTIEGPAFATDENNVYVFRNTGHAVQVSFSPGYPGTLLIGKDVYPLVQLHFHTPSEHIVVTDHYPAGKQFAGELHFVHQRDDGRLAVLGVLLDDSHGSTGDNPILQKIIDYTPHDHDTYNKAGADQWLDPSRLIPADDPHVYAYAGSLTTPPCSEGVSWYVVSEPLKVAPAQIKKLEAFFPANSRVIQNTATRTVEIHNHLHVDQDQNPKRHDSHHRRR